MQMKLDLGAYQFLEIEQDPSAPEQYAIVKLTTPMDIPFKNRTVTARLSNDAQQKIINALEQNLRERI